MRVGAPRGCTTHGSRQPHGERRRLQKGATLSIVRASTTAAHGILLLRTLVEWGRRGERGLKFVLLLRRRVLRRLMRERLHRPVLGAQGRCQTVHAAVSACPRSPQGRRVKPCVQGHARHVRHEGNVRSRVCRGHARHVCREGTCEAVCAGAHTPRSPRGQRAKPCTRCMHTLTTNRVSVWLGQYGLPGRGPTCGQPRVLRGRTQCRRRDGARLGQDGRPRRGPTCGQPRVLRGRTQCCHQRGGAKMAVPGGDRPEASQGRCPARGAPDAAASKGRDGWAKTLIPGGDRPEASQGHCPARGTPDATASKGRAWPGQDGRPRKGTTCGQPRAQPTMGAPGAVVRGDVHNSRAPMRLT